jgi:hypothetical protein
MRQRYFLDQKVSGQAQSSRTSGEGCHQSVIMISGIQKMQKFLMPMAIFSLLE